MYSIPGTRTPVAFVLDDVVARDGLGCGNVGLATELGDFNVNVNAISPSATRTEVPRETVTEEQWQQFAQAQCLKRPEVADDLVGTVLFLASSDSDFITGQTINVDGGLRFH